MGMCQCVLMQEDFECIRDLVFKLIQGLKSDCSQFMAKHKGLKSTLLPWLLPQLADVSS